MGSLLAVPPRPDAAAEGIDVSGVADQFQTLKACSVVTYGEMTLLRLPWSGVHRRNENGVASITFQSHEHSSSHSGGDRWRVSCRGAGLVGTFERSVFRALEWMAIEASLARGVAFSNPLIVHPRDICERLCWRATHPQFEAIKKAMNSLCTIEIEGSTEGISGAPHSGHIGVLRSVIEGPPITTDRTLTGPNLLVYFDRFFVDSVNSGHVRPLNWGLWIALRDPIAQRLLEILDTEFACHDGTFSAAFECETISRLLPLDGAIPRGRRLILLEKAHEALVNTGYLMKAERLPSRGGELFLYHPGPTYYAMRRRLEQQPSLHSFYWKLSQDILGNRGLGSQGKAATRIEQRKGLRA